MTLYALINAEELGITSGNIDGLKLSPVISCRSLGGAEGNMGELLGLGADWSYNAIKQVGNYGEIYERTVAPIGIPRAGSVNDLWTRGGILYAPQFGNRVRPKTGIARSFFNIYRIQM